MTENHDTDSVETAPPSFVFGLSHDFQADDSRDVVEPLTGKVTFRVRRWGHEEFETAHEQLEVWGRFKTKLSKVAIDAATRFPNSNAKREKYINAQTAALREEAEGPDVNRNARALSDSGIEDITPLMIANDKGKLVDTDFSTEICYALLTDRAPLSAESVVEAWEEAGMLTVDAEDGPSINDLRSGKKVAASAREMTLGEFLTDWLVFESKQTEQFRQDTTAGALKGLASGSGGS